MHILTEALRSFLLRVAWEYDNGIQSGNGGLVMNYAAEVVQQVAEINLEIHAARRRMDPLAEKLVRDSFIWTHIAGDAVQRMKVAQRLLRSQHSLILNRFTHPSSTLRRFVTTVRCWI